MNGTGFEAFAQAATGGLVAAVWQGALLAGAAWLGLRLLPKTPAAVRFAIWFGVFLVAAGLPFAAQMPQAATSELSANLSSVSAATSPWLTIDSRWCLALLAVWAVASLVRAGMLAASAIRLRAMWQRATPIELPGIDELPQSSRHAQVCISNEVDRPSVIGFFAPKILLPEWLIEKLTDEELRQVILHESSHLGRADDWLNLLQKIALVVFPLNPVLAWVERRLCFERELACDERVLNATSAPKAYASCLATLAEHRMQRNGMSLGLALGFSGFGHRSELGRRVMRILARGERMRPAHARMVFGGAMLALIAGVAELSHSPQLVGFAAPVPIALRQPHASAYQPVVFHPDEAASQLDESVEPAQTQQGSVLPGSARTVSRDARPEAEPTVRVSRWVMVTESQAGYSERVIMTATRVAPSRASDLRSDAATGDDSGQRNDLRAPDSDDAGGSVEQPYRSIPAMAVPVRGGWLVIRM